MKKLKKNEIFSGGGWSRVGRASENGSKERICAKTHSFCGLGRERENGRRFVVMYYRETYAKNGCWNWEKSCYVLSFLRFKSCGKGSGYSSDGYVENVRKFCFGGSG